MWLLGIELSNSLEEQAMLLTTEPSLQSPNYLFLIVTQRQVILNSQHYLYNKSKTNYYHGLVWLDSVHAEMSTTVYSLLKTYNTTLK